MNVEVRGVETRGARCEVRGAKTAVLAGLVVALLSVPCTRASAQTGKADDVWRHVELGEAEVLKEKNYCLRIYGYYRYTYDETAFAVGRQDKMYCVSEGICEIDVRYDRREDEGVELMVARNLVHPDRPGEVMNFYELAPYTFVEKARRQPRRYTIETAGDTTRVYTKRGLAGTAVRDTTRREVHMRYNALAPDTVKTINIIILSAHLRNVKADAVYAMTDDDVAYVPQGQLRRITFEGDVDCQLYPGMGMVNGSNRTANNTREAARLEYHERSELYVDSVAYMTRAEYKADRKTSTAERRRRSGYTAADIDRLKQKLGVPPLSAEQLQRIEDQRDWEDQTEHWEKTHALPKTLNKMGDKIEKLMESESMQKATDAAGKMIDAAVERQARHGGDDE